MQFEEARSSESLVHAYQTNLLLSYRARNLRRLRFENLVSKFSTC